MTRATYWWRNKYLGEADRPPFTERGKEFPVEGACFFCEKCGEIWARVVVEGQPFRVWAVPCERHESPYWPIVWGSMWLEWDKEHNSALPLPALLREVEVHMHHYERLKERYETK